MFVFIQTRRKESALYLLFENDFDYSGTDCIIGIKIPLSFQIRNADWFITDIMQKNVHVQVAHCCRPDIPKHVEIKFTLLSAKETRTVYNFATNIPKISAESPILGFQPRNGKKKLPSHLQKMYIFMEIKDMWKFLDLL